MSDQQGGGSSGYAPRSPDLNAYHSYSSDSFQQQQQGYGYSFPQAQPGSGFGMYNQGPAPGSYQPPPLQDHGVGDPTAHGATLPAAIPPATTGTGRGRGRVKKEGQSQSSLPAAPAKKRDPVEAAVEVRTKFPVARIKRIMQADEDVGKVAQVSPSLVSKALELFMISLVTKSHAEAKAKNARRVQATHLKAAVEKDEQFDFLTSIVAKVPDAAAKEEGEDGEGRRKKRASAPGEGRGRGRGRGRAKVESEEE